MLRLFALTVTFLALCSMASPKLIPYRKNDKWGYCTVSKKIVISPVYDEAGFFDSNVAWVKKGEQWALVDSKGKQLTPFKYRLGYPLVNTAFCVNGLIRVFADNKFGFINTKGAEVIPCMYDRATFFEKGSAKVSINGTYSLIDTKGKEITTARYDEIYEFHQDIAVVRIGDKLGYIDRKGKEITKVIYDSKIYKTGDCKGEFVNGYARVCKNDSCGYIDKAGTIVVPLKYKFVQDFVAKLFIVHNFDNSRSLLNMQGKKLFEKNFYSAGNSDYSIGVSEEVNGHLISYDMSFSGKKISIPSVPDSIEYWSISKDLFAFRSNEWHGYGILTRSGRVLYPEHYFSQLDREKNGMIQFTRREDKSGIGFMNSKGKIVIPPKHLYAFDFIEDKVILRDLNWKYRVVNKRGREIIAPKYSDLKVCSNGFYLVSIIYESQGSPSSINGYVSPNGIEYWEDTRIFRM